MNVGSIPIRLQWVTTADSFRDKVLRAMYKHLTKRLGSPAFQTSIRRGSRKILERELRAHPTFQSMVAHDGKLRRELGVVDSQSAMESLVRDWVRSVDVKVGRPRLLRGSSIAGTIITLRAIQADYDDVLSKAYASYTTEKGQHIPWLNWLLTQGSEILVATHVPVRIPTARTSRTGTNTIMVKSKGSGWGVPTEYAGMPENNYCTQSIAKAVPDIEKLFIDEVNRRF